MPSAFETYIKKMEEDLRRGNATEYTYRGNLETFLESFARGIDASNDPKHIACGAPDFIVEKGKVPLGYIETKDVGVELDKIERSDQMKRYLKALNNLLLTDYLEFRWYINGEKKRVVRLATIGKNNRLVVNPLAERAVSELITDFFATETPTVNTPKELAQRLAAVTHFIRNLIIESLQSGDPDTQKSLASRYNAFKELLLPALKPEEFADLYSQTMTYGLFAAKMSALDAPFSLITAYQFLTGNRFLKRLFSDVSEELDDIDIIRPYLQDIVSLLNRSHMHEILADFGKRTRTEDPVVHFYETFLAAYDPKMRESRGVYYTPEPVVQFIVNAVDEVLKTRFNKPWGLADDSVKVLDPATGTGTFLYYVIQKIHEEVVTTRGQAGQWPAKSKKLLKRLFGFELLIAPYVVSHLKLGLLLKELGAPLEGRDERLQVYLTNTLEEGVTRSEHLAGLGSYIAEEASDAAQVKKLKDIMVVLGNPPYSNFGMMNKGKWITELIEDYKKGLNEKKINLDDDFIKFIRFGQWRIEKTGEGILAYITNNTFIDGITHRQMRKSLLETFDEIYVLDLHGSSKKKEITPNGEVDQNVFDIQQGVSINIFIKTKNKVSDRQVHHSEIWGSRESKYDFLNENGLSKIHWNLSQPKKDSYLFIPKQNRYEEEYLQYYSINTICPQSISGVQTKNDNLFVSFSQKELGNKLKGFFIAVNNSDKQIITQYLGSLENTEIEKYKNVQLDTQLIRPYMVFPFDIRFIYYDKKLIGRARYQVMKHLLRNNFGFIFMRQSTNQGTYDQFLVSRELMTDRVFYSAHGAPFFAPLYLYNTPEDTIGTLFEQTEITREPNLSPAFIKDFSALLKLQFVPDGQGDLKTTFGPEDVFYYAYAVFHSPTYRARYAEFLKIDFPRLPLTSDKKLFAKLVKLGKELVELHLLKSAKVEDFITTYSVPGNNHVEKVTFISPSTLGEGAGGEASGGGGRVYINTNQFFGSVPQEVWQFKIGGYQVCDKWLKDRKGRTLTGEDITHYQRVVVALRETIRLMAEIDRAIPQWPIT